MWNKLIALAVTIPMTITIASAQAAQDADIAAYSQDLAMRIARGRQSGQLSAANYNSVQALYNNVEMIRRSIGNKPMNPMIRANMMSSLTNLDKQLTGYLKDDVNSRYQMWDPTRKTWRNNWWRADNSGANNFNTEIDAYQNSLKERIDRGRASGRITRNELNQLALSYDNIDKAQQQYRIGGFSSWERNSLMSMLTQLDKDITAQMRDDENSHYRNWNPNGNSWNNSWWKNTSQLPTVPPNRHDSNSQGNGRDRFNRGESGDHGNWNRDSSRHDWGRGESDRHGDWDRGDGNRNDSNRGNWNRGESHHGDWNRGDSGRPGWSRNDGGRPDWNRAGSGSSGSGAGSPSGGSATGNVPPVNTAPGAGAPPQNNPPSGANNPPSGSGNTSRNTPLPSTGNTAPPANTPQTGNNPPAGNPGAGSSQSGDGRRGGWSGERTGEGRSGGSGATGGTGGGSGRTWGGSGSGGTGGTGDGSGRTWGGGSGDRRPQN